MPSAFTHAVAAASLGTCFSKPQVPKLLFVIAALCSAIPDLDIIGFRFGIRYGDFWGHRGFTHSLAFALVLAVCVTLGFFCKRAEVNSLTVASYIFLATASHGVLDAMTDGGLGVAFFSPFDTDRYFLPWRPIRVAPLSPARFFTARGFTILQSEVLWVWIPAIAFAALVFLLRRTRMRTAAAGN